MTTLRDMLSSTAVLKKQYGSFGMEIETETKSYSSYPSDFFSEAGTNSHGLTDFLINDLEPYWKATTDGSLRNYGMEFVFKKPLPLESSMKAIDLFCDVTSARKIKFLKDQPSTSVHVHMNVQNFSAIQLMNFLCIWTMFENCLADFCGDTRRSNLFASPIRVVEGQLQNYFRIIEAIEEKSSMKLVFDSQSVKYSALNIATMATFGSLEARLMRGTTDRKELKDWLGILNQIYTYAQTPELTPRKFLNSWAEKELNLMAEIFGDYFSLITNSETLSQIERNLPYVFLIVSQVKNWDTFGMNWGPSDTALKSKFSQKTLNILMNQYNTLSSF